jgi:hypothetical protein
MTSSISVHVARTFIQRATESGKTKGVKRDRDALEFVCGAAAAVKAVAEDPNTATTTAINAGEQYKSLEWTAFMVASRGFAFLEELVKEKGQS